MRHFIDLSDDKEDDRIRQIGEKVMKDRVTVGFITEDEPGKADRYIAKLKASFPGIYILRQGPGPVANTVLVKVSPPLQ